LTQKIWNYLCTVEEDATRLETANAFNAAVGFAYAITNLIKSFDEAYLMWQAYDSCVSLQAGNGSKELAVI